MGKYLFVAFREWALSAYRESCLDMPIITQSSDLKKVLENNHTIEYIFFVGWSEIISSDIIEKYYCLCVHPSKLPLYRGGSPIQNQIIDGVIESAVSLFRMNHEVDSGPIVDQRFLSLNGSLDEILTRISSLTADLIRSFIEKIETRVPIVLKEQDHTKAKVVKRRKPSQSEITLEDLKSMSALQLYNKIRCLSDPYPNAYFTCGDGKKLYIQKASIE